MCELLSATQQLPAGGGAFLAEIHGAPVRVFEKAVALDLAEGTGRALGNVLACIERHETAAARYEIHHALECSLHGFEVGVDVGVVELDVCQDCGIRKVVQELWALVEEGGVVLVAFENERPRAVLHMEAAAEVFCDATDEKRWLPARCLVVLHTRCCLVDPREHAGGRGLAVRAADDEALAALQEFVVDKRSHRGHGDALVEYDFELCIAARDGVANDDKVWAGFEILRGVRFHDGDAHRAELVTHRRVGRGVRTGDAMALRAQHARERCHGRSADSNQMHMLCSAHETSSTVSLFILTHAPRGSERFCPTT